MNNSNPLIGLAAIASTLVIWAGLTYFDVFGFGVQIGMLFSCAGFVAYVHGWILRLMVAGLGLLIPGMVMFAVRPLRANHWFHLAEQLDRIEADVQALKNKAGV
jgi:hypothetical protein